MAESNTTAAKKTKTGHRSVVEAPTRVNGDPGIGGLLADPQETVRKVKRRRNMPAGPPSPDSELPEAHGDWAPNRAWRG